MHSSVQAIFPEFSKRFEGYVHWMYLDIKGLVTTGVGMVRLCGGWAPGFARARRDAQCLK